MMRHWWMALVLVSACDKSALTNDTSPQDLDGDGFFTPDDCNDADPTAFPDAPELCDGVDNNCDGLVDEDAAGNDRSYYVDSDQDGFGDPTEEVFSCAPPAGTVGSDTDCDDADDAIFPGAPETDCTDPVDYNCDGSTGFADIDSDGSPACEDCDDNDPNAFPGGVEDEYDGVDNDCDPLTLDDDLDQDGVLAAEDCDDRNPDASPDLPEDPYDGVDNDCDPLTVDDDLDQDGVLAADDCDDLDNTRSPLLSETPFDGIDNDCDPTTLDNDGDGDGVAADLDCDDADPNVAPTATEEPYNGVDDDCDPLTLDDDLDEDGFGADEDCDDDNASISPGAPERFYNDIDDDCDPTTNDDDADADGVLVDADCDDTDGSAFPGNTETWYNGVDNDCSGGSDFDQDGDGIERRAPGESGTDCLDTDASVSVCGLSEDAPTESCAVLHDEYPQATSGTYWVDGGLQDPVQVQCDMDFSGGGWTVISPCDALNTWSGEMVAVDDAGTQGIDASCRPFTRDESGSHTFHYTFTYPPGFTDIVMRDWVVRANARSGDTSDLSFQQTAWSRANGSPDGYASGDVSFGSADESGPVASLRSTGAFIEASCQSCERVWPNPTTVYTVPQTTQFRFGWGETGSQHEGWYPWWSGEVYLR